MVMPALIPILLSGWVASVVLFVIGNLQRAAVLVGYGILLAGVMVLVTSTLLFTGLSRISDGGYRVTAAEIFTIGLLGFLGGALAMLGSSYVVIASKRSSRVATP